MGKIVNIPGTSSAIKVEKKGKKYVYYMRDKEEDDWEIYRTKKSPLEITRGTDVGNGIEELLGNRTDYSSYNIKQINVELDKYFSEIVTELADSLNVTIEESNKEDIEEKYDKLYSKYLVKKEKYQMTDLQFLAQICQGLGVGLADTILKIYISYLLTVLKIKATNVIAIGSQSSGKSFSIEGAIKMIPSEYVIYGVHTEAYFFGKFNGMNLDRHIFYLGDLGGTKDDEKTIITRDILKQLNTDGYVERGIAPDSEPTEQYVEGNPAITYSTVEDYIINEQEKSRSNIVKPPNISLEDLTLFNAFFDSPGMDYKIIETIKEDVESVQGLTWHLMEAINNYELFNPYMFCITDFLQNMDDFNRKIKEYNKILLVVCLLNKPLILTHNIYYDKEKMENINTKLVIASKQDVINALDLFSGSNNLLPTELDFLKTLCSKYTPYPIEIEDDTTIREYENEIIEDIEIDGVISDWEGEYVGWDNESTIKCFFTVSTLKREYGNIKAIKDIKNNLSNKLRKLYENNYLVKIGQSNKNENIYGLVFDIDKRLNYNIPFFRKNEMIKSQTEFKRKYPNLYNRYCSFIEKDFSQEIKDKNYNVDNCEIYNIPWG